MESFRYFLEFAYNGSGFHGWQMQPNAHTVQEQMQHALSMILGNPVMLTGAGRTDTGVHARCFFAHFDSGEWMDVTALALLVARLNRFLPSSIAIYNAYSVKPDIHARFSALSRTYRYYISRKKDPFSVDFSWNYTAKLDVDSMKIAAETLLEYKDFTCFTKSHTQTLTNDCLIYESNFMEEGSMLIYHVKANRFLRNMVRAIVGTMIEVGKGTIDSARLRGIIEKGTRSDAGMSVPACGLFLEDIEYPPDIRLLP
ncbi:MAG: tRNA pseudouridine(38-40) synthase TruA [Bacteroidales bacterium]|nr:tRNA pseudouridine(38-40) synthase TruA [Bacteroidales bacterium]